MTKQQLENEILALSELMEEVGAKMDYFGGFNKIGDHGREMIGAAMIAKGWAKGIQDESTGI